MSSNSSKSYFGYQDIKKMLYDISSLTQSERKIVEDDLMEKYKGDYKLTKAEIIKVVSSLVNKYKISMIDKESIYKRFGITYDDIRKSY